MRVFSSHDCLTPSLLSVSLSVFIPCTLALFIAPPQPVSPCLFLFPGSVSPYLSPLAVARVSLLALQTITSIHQLSAQSSLASSLPFSQRWDNNPHSPAYTCSFATPSLNSHPCGQLNVPHSTLGLFSLPTPLSASTPPVASLIPDVPAVNVCVCVWKERTGTKGWGAGLGMGGQIEVSERVV